MTAGAVAPDYPLAGLVAGGDRVLVVGGYGTGNTGDDAILAGMLASLPGDALVTVVSRTPSETERIHGVRAVGPRGALAAMLRSDSVVIGGGGMFSAHMGPFARAIPLFGLGARALGKRVIVHGVGIYGSTPGLVRPALRMLLRRAALVTVRDSASAETMRSWNVPCLQIDDLSARMPPARDERVVALMERLHLDPGRRAVGLALAAVNRDQETLLVREIPALVSGCPDVQFCFIPMSRHPDVARHDDRVLGRSIQAVAPGLRLLEEECRPADVLGLFGRLDAVVAMRYHALLFAERAGTPVIPVSYAEKTADWIRTRGIEGAPIDATVLADRIRRSIGEAASENAP